MTDCKHLIGTRCAKHGERCESEKMPYCSGYEPCNDESKETYLVKRDVMKVITNNALVSAFKNDAAYQKLVSDIDELLTLTLVNPIVCKSCSDDELQFIKNILKKQDIRIMPEYCGIDNLKEEFGVEFIPFLVWAAAVQLKQYKKNGVIALKKAMEYIVMAMKEIENDAEV